MSDYGEKAKAFGSGLYGGAMDYLRYPAQFANFGFSKLGLRSPEEARQAHQAINQFSDNPPGVDLNNAKQAYPAAYQTGNAISGMLMGQLLFRGFSPNMGLVKASNGYFLPPPQVLNRAGRVKALRASTAQEGMLEPAADYGFQQEYNR